MKQSEFDYTWERLSDRIEVCVTPDHKFGTDAFLLSKFADVRRKDKVVDLGTGCGIIPLLWFRGDSAPTVAYGVDIQAKAIEQLRLTVGRSGLSEKLNPVLADLKDLSAVFERDQFDVVTCNPPYKAANSGILSGEDSHQIARHEILCGMGDVCRAAAKLLKFGGRLCVCQRPERLADTLESMRQSGLEPKRVRFVQQHGHTAPWLFLAEGKKGSKPFMKVEAPLIIENPAGGFSDELLKIYGKDSNLPCRNCM